MPTALPSQTDMPERWLNEPLADYELLQQVITVAESLLAVCDAVDQPVAGNHLSMAIDILRADSELRAQIASGVLGR